MELYGSHHVNVSGVFPPELGADMLLIHGASHHAASWKDLQEALLERQITSVAMDLPSATDPATDAGVADDVAVIREAVERFRPRVVVCHSYGGVPTTAAIRASDQVEVIVYLAAFMPDHGESLNTIPSAPHTAATADEYQGWEVTADGKRIFAVNPRELFYNTCRDDTALTIIPTLTTHSLRSFSDTIDHVAWRELSTVYILTLQDRAIPPSYQSVMADRATRTLTIDSDHSPFLGRVDATADILSDLLREYSSAS